MKITNKIWKLLAAVALAAALLCGCSADAVSLPDGVDLFAGESYSLANAARYQGGAVDPSDAAALRDVTVSFVSTDPAVATVDAAGVVQAVAPGQAVIVINCIAFDYYAEVPVTVADPPADLTIDPAVTVAVGGTATLETAVRPQSDAAVTYQSADPAVAAVDEAGVVTGVAPGETTVTAAVAGTSLTASCTVTVGDAVRSVALTRAEAALTAGARFQLGARVAPAAGQTVVWQSSDPSVATVDADGQVTAVAAGTADISATAGGKTAVCRLTVTPAPETATPETATPETATPETATPETATPETATPETATPETATPETATPETATPETATPETATPETATPETATPETATPETAAPEAEGGLRGWLRGIGRGISGFFSGVVDFFGGGHGGGQ